MNKYLRDISPKNISLGGFKKRIDSYFEKCEKDNKPPTITGLSIAIGFSTRTAIYDSKLTPSKRLYTDRAMMRVEEWHEEQLSLKSNPSGHIFFLKNMGWKDQREVNHTHVNLTDLFSGKKTIENPTPKELRKKRGRPPKKENIQLQKGEKIIDVEVMEDGKNES